MPWNIHDAAHLGLETCGKAMRICPRNPGTCTWRERLREEIDELPGTDEFRKGMCSRLDEAKHLLSCYDRKEIREWRPRNRREEKMTPGLVDPK